VADATGAGDVFAAGLLNGLVEADMADINRAAQKAVRWAVRTLQTEGSIPPEDLCQA